MRIIILNFLFFLSLEASISYDKGKTLYMQKGCYSCHGSRAEGMHMYPRLANRAKGYLSYKLKKFRNKQSDNQQQEMMIAYALSLSDEDIENLSVFMAEFIDEENAQSYDDSFETWGDGGS
ncbi:MAG: c-type cytochrome [Campylobacterota bacterium]|nr:c-type cytochrome [Campylobacterota bacterium]